jgi:pyrroline-5-carboxylate reductase
MHTSNITIIGAGNMGASLLGGLIANQFPSKQLTITDSDPEKLHLMRQQFNVNTSENNIEVVATADVIILAVKPQVIATITREFSSAIQVKKPLIISVAAGIREENLQNWLGGHMPIVRCMPNTPALIRAGATALYANSFVTTKQHDLAESVLRAVGMVIWLHDEKQMDAVTALSGSGPAYFFLVIEALQAAAEKLGLPEETARLLTLQTAVGSARMAMESNVSANELRQRVTSPGGTTEAALRILEEEHLFEIFQKALQTAKNRSEELAELFGKKEK